MITIVNFNIATVFQSTGPKHTVDGRNPAQPCIVETLKMGSLLPIKWCRMFFSIQGVSLATIQQLATEAMAHLVC